MPWSWQILKPFARSFYQAFNPYFRKVSSQWVRYWKLLQLSSVNIIILKMTCIKLCPQKEVRYILYFFCYYFVKILGLLLLSSYMKGNTYLGVIKSTFLSKKLWWNLVREPLQRACYIHFTDFTSTPFF